MRQFNPEEMTDRALREEILLMRSVLAKQTLMSFFPDFAAEARRRISASHAELTRRTTEHVATLSASGERGKEPNQ